MIKTEKVIKLDPKKSRFAKEQEHKQNFQANVDEAVEKNQNYNILAQKLGQEFLNIISDRTLMSEKTLPIQEKEINLLRQLIDLGNNYNNDLLLLEDNKEGMGSIILASLMFKTLLMFRNRINELEYKLQLRETPQHQKA